MGLVGGLDVFGGTAADLDGTDKADAALRDVIVPGPLDSCGTDPIFLAGSIDLGCFFFRCWNVSGTSPTVHSSSIIFNTLSSSFFADFSYPSACSLSICVSPFSST